LWVADPQVAFEIARKARDAIQDLDARLRGHDNKHGFRVDDKDVARQAESSTIIF